MLLLVVISSVAAICFNILYNVKTGIVTGLKATFKAFILQYPKGSWLHNMPLGNYSIYKKVFWYKKLGRLKLFINEEDDTTESEEDNTIEVRLTRSYIMF